jgi:hypothetical protein
MNTYEKLGYEDRLDYLKQLAEDMDVDYGIVLQMADLLGPDEDFDGLVSMLEDYCERDYDDGMDGDHASALASAGWGTDEDYA